MASLKILLYKSNKNKKGQFSLSLRITKNGKPKYIHIEWLDEKYWNSKKEEVRRSHPFAEHINTQAQQKLALAKKIIAQYVIEERDYDLATLVDRVKKNRSQVSFFDLSQENLTTLLEKEYYSTYRAVIYSHRRFREFLNQKEIFFKDITPKLIRSFISFLEVKNYAKTVIINTLAYIRKIYNMAITQKIASADDYPFGRRYTYKIKGKSSAKIGLITEELIRFSQVSLTYKSKAWYAQKYFLFAFYLAGVRISDALKIQWKDIVDDRLYYEMGKNQKRDSLKFPQEALEILKQLKEDKTSPNDFVFPFLQGISMKDKKAVYKRIHATKSIFNYHLKRIAKKANIDKNISCHIARHTFGTIAGSQIPLRSLQKLYRHSDISTTMNYQQHFDHSVTDEALQNVVSLSKAS